MNQAADSKDRPFIDAVESRVLRERARDGAMDPGSEALKKAEEEYIRNWRRERENGEDKKKGGGEGGADDGGDRKPTNLIGLALSGGGIRSATFSLGVMQSLANRDLLKKVDYISTVSGGGYIGSSLTWLLSKKARDEATECEIADGGGKTKPKFGLSSDDFPYGSDDPKPDGERNAGVAQERMLRYLREHGYYLSPGKGITILSLLGVILRGTILNLLVWVPAFVLFFMFGLGLFHQVSGVVPTPILGYAFSSLNQEQSPQEQPSPGQPNREEIDTGTLFGFEMFLWISVGLIGFMILGLIVYSVMTKKRRTAPESERCDWYRKRRKAEQWTAVLLPMIVITLLVGSLPILGAALHGWMKAVGPAAVLAGMGTAIGFFLRFNTSRSALPSGAIVTLAAALFLYGLIMVSFQIAHSWFLHFDTRLDVVILLLLVVLCVGTGWFVNLNYISIHRYYRDRLMESYLPDIGSALQNETGAAMGADGAYLHEVVDESNPTGPYHLTNTNLVLVDSKDRRYSDRGGDNFILSPGYCGSNATGWCPTKAFMQGRMTLPTAMAISAAAANPNTGVGGQGLTRNTFLSLLMALLNLGIGYWATHPNPKRSPDASPNHFLPGIYAIGSVLGMKGRFGFHEKRPFIQLTDGGHFENMAVYELVRRRVKLIIVCDGGADPDFSFSDFQTTIRRIEDDFGARAKVDDKATPDQVVPVPTDKKTYPKDGMFAPQGHMVATITYANGEKAKLIFLKTALIDGVSFKVKGYAAQNPDFPDQSTADQFFDEVQFESYRELGYRIADKMLDSDATGPLDDLPSAEKLKDLIRVCAEAQ